MASLLRLEGGWYAAPAGWTYDGRHILSVRVAENTAKDRLMRMADERMYESRRRSKMRQHPGGDPE